MDGGLDRRSSRRERSSDAAPLTRGDASPCGDGSSAVTAALGDYLTGHAETVAVAELDEAARIVAENPALVRLAGRSRRGERFHEIVAREQWPALDLALSGADATWEQLILGLAPDARGVPLDFAVAVRRLRAGWLVVAEPAQATVSMVNERLLALNDELAGAERRIARQHAELERQNDRLRELDQLKDALLANVSHDLRTPLTAILGYAELMTRRGGLSEQHARSAAIVERNARRLLRMVNDLLLLAQARAGRLELAREAVDLSDLVTEACELARPLAAQAHLSLTCEMPASGTLVITGDRLRLAQLLDNLLANALKFTPAGGHVVVRAAAGRSGARLEVLDDGPGIAPAEQARLYEAFARGANAEAPGTGLGLTIVREIANAHNACVSLECTDGSTRFTVTFPQAS